MYCIPQIAGDVPVEHREALRAPLRPMVPVSARFTRRVGPLVPHGFVRSTPTGHRSDAVTVRQPTEDRDGELTLLFTLSAARSLSDPASAFEDARRWSRYVGVIANDTAEVEAFVRRHGIENDFELRAWDKWGTTESIRKATNTPRHVLVGTSETDRRLAEVTEWEFRTVTEAAGRAGWALGNPGRDDGESGIVRRIRRFLGDRLR